MTLLLTFQVMGVGQLSRDRTRLENVRDVYEVRRDVPLAPPAEPPPAAPARRAARAAPAVERATSSMLPSERCGMRDPKSPRITLDAH